MTPGAAGGVDDVAEEEALRELAARLRRRGLHACAYGSTLTVQPPRLRERERILVVHEGSFCWDGDNGAQICGIGDPAEAAAHIDAELAEVER